MKLTYIDEREQICDICNKLWQKGWVAASDGNVSIRLANGTVLITPAKVGKCFMEPEKLLHVDMDGNVLEGRKNTTHLLK